MAKCRACGAEIRWVQTKNGKNMPVDSEAVSVEVGVTDPDTCVVTGDGRVVWGKKHEGSVTGYVVEGRISHFATCLESGRFRKG